MSQYSGRAAAAGLLLAARSPRRPRLDEFSEADALPDAMADVTIAVLPASPVLTKKASTSSKLAFDPTPLNTHAIAHANVEPKLAPADEDDAEAPDTGLAAHQHVGFC